MGCIISKFNQGKLSSPDSPLIKAEPQLCSTAVTVRSDLRGDLQPTNDLEDEDQFLHSALSNLAAPPIISRIVVHLDFDDLISLMQAVPTFSEFISEELFVHPMRTIKNKDYDMTVRLEVMIIWLEKNKHIYNKGQVDAILRITKVILELDCNHPMASFDDLINFLEEDLEKQRGPEAETSSPAEVGAQACSQGLL